MKDRILEFLTVLLFDSIFGKALYVWLLWPIAVGKTFDLPAITYWQSILLVVLVHWLCPSPSKNKA